MTCTKPLGGHPWPPRHQLTAPSSQGTGPASPVSAACCVSQGPFLLGTEPQTRGTLLDLGLPVHICFPASPLLVSRPCSLWPAVLPKNWGSGKGNRGGGSTLPTTRPGTHRPCPNTVAVSPAGRGGPGSLVSSRLQHSPEPARSEARDGLRLPHTQLPRGQTVLPQNDRLP